MIWVSGCRRLEKKKSPETSSIGTVIAVVGQWDEGEAAGLFESALERLRGQHPPGAIPWATKHRPELMEDIHNAARRYNEAFQNQNLAGCRQAAAEYEQAGTYLFITVMLQHGLNVSRR